MAIEWGWTYTKTERRGYGAAVTGWCHPVLSPQPCQVQLKLVKPMGNHCSPQPSRHRWQGGNTASTGFENCLWVQVEPGFSLCVQKCFCFTDCCSLGCSAKHRLWAGSSGKQEKGLIPAPAAWCGLFLEFHTSVAVGSGAEPVDVQGECAGHKWCSDTSTPARASSLCLGAELWGVLVLVTKLISKMTAKNCKHLPPCLFAFVGSDLLLICNRKASLVFWLAVSFCRSTQCLRVPASPAESQCLAVQWASPQKNPHGKEDGFMGSWDNCTCARTCPQPGISVLPLLAQSQPSHSQGCQGMGIVAFLLLKPKSENPQH